MQKFDVLIVGAGMVGLTLALAIRKHSQLTVALVDNTPPTPLKTEPETRVSAINAVSQQLFKQLNVWDIISVRHQAYQHMHIWDKAGGEPILFGADEVESDQLGWIIENKVIRNALWECCEADADIHMLTNDTLSDISLGESEAFVSFEQRSPVIAKLVVGADGANSWVRKHMNFSMSFRDYDHHAIVGTVKCSQGHQNTAWQVFLAEGPLALLPLKSRANDLCSIVWSTSPEEAKRLTALTDTQFSKEITNAVDGKLGMVTLESQRFTYPLSMRLCQQFVKDRVALVGDAAHTIHPLAGQGVNLGLLDAAVLAQTITQNKTDEHDATSVSNIKNSTLAQNHLLNTQLNAYSRWRKTEATEMVAAMEGIKQLFTPQHTIIQNLRSLGMALINKAQPVKNLLIKKALGYKGKLPLLAQREVRKP